MRKKGYAVWYWQQWFLQQEFRVGNPVSEIQNEKAKNESELKDVQSKISGIESQKSSLSSRSTV